MIRTKKRLRSKPSKPSSSALRQLAGFGLLLLGYGGATQVARAAERPNVIVIMADDLGAEGLACYGSTLYSSPRLDQLASEGLRLNNAYATPLCTPTRVMIMSGLEPHRTGHLALLSKKPGTRLSPEIRTFGQDFQQAGYRTAIAGKWQLGQFDDFPEQAVEHGFDEYCLWTWMVEREKTSRYYQPSYRTDSQTHVAGPEVYGPDVYADFVLDFIDRHREAPFFVYFPMALVHSPFEHPPRLEALARSRFPPGLDKNTQAFGHMITYMDDIVGQIVDRLEAHGIAENTLLLFTADNGTHRSITSQLPGLEVKGDKGAMTEAGTRVPFLAWWPGTIQPGVSEKFFSLVDVLPTIASLADLPLGREVDGMDLGHYFLGTEGRDREQVFMAYKAGQFFVRDREFRLSLAENREPEEILYHIPVTSGRERYREKVSRHPEHEAARAHLRRLLQEYQTLPPSELSD
ncbi:MAG: sulfatase-like hydrolase/transferase [Verrucomicrobiota bacterium]